MPFIHQISNWPSLTWSDEVLSEPLATVRHRQGLLLGKMKSLGFDLFTEASLTVLTSEIVKSSAIEGKALNPDEVRSSLAKRLGLEDAGLPQASRDVDGIVEMMLDATQHNEEPLTPDRLFGWHAALFPTGRSGIRKITVGDWRPIEAGPMQVVSGAIGNERVHFEAPRADRLETEMAAFLEWFNAPLAMDPVLKAGLAHFWFVTIHPFEDGNGRIARAIADMALARADGIAERFYSMSTQIEAERKAYYLLLESAQRSSLDITAWMTWFIGCLDRAIVRAEDTLSAVLDSAALWERMNHRSVNDRQRKVVTRMLNNFQGFMTTSKYAKMTKCSPDTALRDIKELVAWGVMTQNPGGGRSTSYSLITADGFSPGNPAPMDTQEK